MPARLIQLPTMLGTATALAAAAFLSACAGGTTPAPQPVSSFTARVTGGAERPLAGTATYMSDVAGPDAGFGLALVQTAGTAGETRHAVYFRRMQPGTLAVGTYLLADTPDGTLDGGVVLDGDGDDPLLCTATDGALVIESSSPTKLAGRFVVVATCASAGGEPLADAIRVEGRFEATPGTITVPGDDIATVAGSTYALAEASGGPLPFQAYDYTVPGDGARKQLWFLGDTIRFRTDGQLTQLTLVRTAESAPGEPADVSDWFSGRGGYFRQAGARIPVAWGYITAPAESEYRDTLVVRGRTLARRVTLPRACAGCADGATVEFLYVRQ